MNAAAASEPRFRRPAPDDAVDVARELFDGGERVDVLAVARRLGVSRATMHRWFGTRDQLVAAVLEQVAGELVAEAEAGARGAGDARAYDFTRRIAIASAALAPLRATAEQEPALVLRMMLDPDGPVWGQILAALRRLVGASRTPAQLRRLDPAIATFLDAAVSLHWAAIAAGREPDPERYVTIGRALLTAAEPRTRSVRRKPENVA